jgi:hypothetical protein
MPAVLHTIDMPDSPTPSEVADYGDTRRPTKTDEKVAAKKNSASKCSSDGRSSAHMDKKIATIQESLELIRMPLVSEEAAIESASAAEGSPSSSGETAVESASASGEADEGSPSSSGETALKSPTSSGETAEKYPTTSGETIQKCPTPSGETTLKSPTSSGETAQNSPKASFFV